MSQSLTHLPRSELTTFAPLPAGLRQASPASKNACGPDDAEQQVWEHTQALTSAQRRTRACAMVVKEREEVSEQPRVEDLESGLAVMLRGKSGRRRETILAVSCGRRRRCECLGETISKSHEALETGC